MKKVMLFLFAFLFSASVFAQNPIKTTNITWYTTAGVAKTTMAAGDTAFSTAVQFAPYDSTFLCISAIKGDTLGVIVRCQVGNTTANGTSWSAFQTGYAASLDTLGYTTAAADYHGKAFVWSLPNQPKQPLVRFVLIGTAASGRLNGVIAEKWITSTQSVVVQRIK